MERIPLVSICIPSYNNAKYIRKTIDSIFSQTLQDFEIVICDDKSTDNTVEIVSSYNDPRIKLKINEENLGVFGNWTKTVYLSSGKYVKLVCGDDIINSICLEEQVNVLENDKEEKISLVTCGSSIINAEDKVLFKRKAALQEGVNNSSAVYKKCLTFGTNIIGEPMVGLFRRKILEKNIVYASNKYLIDLDFWFKLLKFGNLFFIDKNLACFRVSNDSLSSRLSLRQASLYREFSRNAIREYDISNFYLIPCYVNSFILGLARNFIFAIALKVK